MSASEGAYIYSVPGVRGHPGWVSTLMINRLWLAAAIIPKSNSTIYGLKSLKHEGNKIWIRLSVDIKTSEVPSYF